MDFMNLNQSAHGDREFGVHRDADAAAPEDRRRALDASRAFASGSAPGRARPAAGTRRSRSGSPGSATTCARSRSPRATRSRRRSGSASRSTATASATSSTRSTQCPDAEVDRLVAEYEDGVRARPGARGRAASGASRCATRRGSRPGCAAFLERGGFKAFTDTFEDLAGCTQLPGIAVQRLMADGYGFGAEGDWKTAALVRIDEGDGRRASTAARRSWRTTRTTSRRASRRCSARTCSRSARRSPAARPSCEIHPLSIGGRGDPVRLVFTARARARRSSRRCSTSATASGSSRTRSSSCAPDEDAAAPAGGAGGVEAEAGLRHRGRGVARSPAARTTRVLMPALGTRRSPTSPRSPASSCSSSTSDDADPRLRERAPLEPGVLPAGRRAVAHGRHAELRERVLEANLAIVRAGLVVLTFGNASAVDRAAGVMAIKPSGVAVRRARGPRRSSSSTSRAARSWTATRGRRRTRRRTSSSTARFAAVGGVVHTHSPFATAWAQARREIPCFGTTHADHFRGPSPSRARSPPAEIEGDYEGRTGDGDRRDVRRPRARPARDAGRARRLARAVRVGRRRERGGRERDRARGGGGERAAHAALAAERRRRSATTCSSGTSAQARRRTPTTASRDEGAAPARRRRRCGCTTSRSPSRAAGEVLRARHGRRALRLRPALVRSRAASATRCSTRPLVLGHEFAGVVAAGPRAGERVAVDPAVPCGRCALVPRRSSSTSAPAVASPATARPTARCARSSPGPSGSLHRCPTRSPTSRRALLEPLGVALHALDLGHVRPGRRRRRLRLRAARPAARAGAARSRGATSMVATDRLAHRVAAAEALGATHAVARGGSELRPAARGGLDVAFEVGGRRRRGRRRRSPRSARADASSSSGSPTATAPRFTRRPRAARA